jgi:hypothetical protein
MEHVDKAILEKTYGGELDRDYDHAAFVARTSSLPLMPLDRDSLPTAPSTLSHSLGEINGEGKPQKGN